MSSWPYVKDIERFDVAELQCGWYMRARNIGNNDTARCLEQSQRCFLDWRITADAWPFRFPAVLFGRCSQRRLGKSTRGEQDLRELNAIQRDLSFRSKRVGIKTMSVTALVMEGLTLLNGELEWTSDVKQGTTCQVQAHLSFISYSAFNLSSMYEPPVLASAWSRARIQASA